MLVTVHIAALLMDAERSQLVTISAQPRALSVAAVRVSELYWARLLTDLASCGIARQKSERALEDM